MTLPPLFLILVLGACQKPQDDETDSPPQDTSSPDTATGETGESGTEDTEHTGETGETGDPVDPRDRWTFAVFMNGDNDLESYVPHDLNELEITGSGDGVNVVVQADRIEGYSSADGDWTGARRYYIVQDEDERLVSSQVVEELGEVDMGSPEVLADFLLWADATFPAEHFVLVMWDHGDSWNFTNPVPPPGVSSDDTSGTWLSVAGGTLAAGLQPLVDQRGPLDVIAFDACLMASWEVAHALRRQALVLAASEASENWEGYQYDLVLDLMRQQSDVTAEEVAVEMARGAVEVGGEDTHSAVDLSRVEAITNAVDDLAGLVYSDASLQEELWEYRDQAGGMYPGWEAWYLDLYDFATLAETSSDIDLAEAGQDIRLAVEDAVLAHYESPRYSFAGGLSIFTDTSSEFALNLYHQGPGALWAQDARWDDLLLEMAGY